MPSPISRWGLMLKAVAPVKLASGQRKPNGQFVIAPAMVPDFVESLSVAKFHGVGPVTAVKMQLGIDQAPTCERNHSPSCSNISAPPPCKRLITRHSKATSWRHGPARAYG
jgi:hypothetical protein